MNRDYPITILYVMIAGVILFAVLPAFGSAVLPPGPISAIIWLIPIVLLVGLMIWAIRATKNNKENWR